MAKNKKLEQLSDLPYYREEYTEQLEKLGVTDLQQLLDALLDDDKKKEIVDELDGVGKKVADHWAEVIEESGFQPSSSGKSGSATRSSRASGGSLVACTARCVATTATARPSCPSDTAARPRSGACTPRVSRK
jgi:hypothetical protein